MSRRAAQGPGEPALRSLFLSLAAASLCHCLLLSPALTILSAASASACSSSTAPLTPAGPTATLRRPSGSRRSWWSSRPPSPPSPARRPRPRPPSPPSRRRRHPCTCSPVCRGAAPTSALGGTLPARGEMCIGKCDKVIDAQGRVCYRGHPSRQSESDSIC